MLIKYLDGAYCTHLLDTYRDARLSDETIGNHAWAERERARPREIQFADTVWFLPFSNCSPFPVDSSEYFTSSGHYLLDEKDRRH